MNKLYRVFPSVGFCTGTTRENFEKIDFSIHSQTISAVFSIFHFILLLYLKSKKKIMILFS